MVLKDSNKGFTLIELLLSLSIFSTLIALSTYSIMHFDRFWNKSTGHFENVRVRYQLLNQLKDVFVSGYPQTVLTSKNGDYTEVYYFLGDESGMTFVTESPIFTGNKAVVRVFKEKDVKGYRLMYEEAPLTDSTPLIYLDQELNFQYRVKMLVSKGNIEFSYCGFKQRFADIDSITRQAPSCYNKFDGVTTSLNPESIVIQSGETIISFRLSNGEALTEKSGFDL
ncbi:MULTISPECIES: prepilin-type N-terminal cleavage/methylation domain-containing protein [Pseudoalteromonas]|uniref:prepilin-type N-terminal cleavage/methylation domain-containing protein n=1 Tax=Pseudoalteromonas TaxID=53246 RepID=UPI0015829716|nr:MULTISPECIES: prepilin-type N-terminal cleavage/methylation domain-containing protein [Pseudoalteromonas]MDI4652082.1 prepilin-type N-terminal cleavage/methylation domain-containing protein [Pseudoalteromonas shioyasakiensis]NUJ38407.1 prepilin-type N-terminal cleavage/methylation domain-containing protein [Pseudoalteromonas sp. 0303]